MRRIQAGERYCLLHIGLPKTGTTLLQKHLFPRHRQIEYLGKIVRRWRSKFRDKAVEKIIMEISREGLFQPDLKKCRRLFHEKIATAFEDGRIPMWSSEGIPTGSADHRRARAENFRAVFGPCRVILTIRHPLSFVESLYFQKLMESHLGRAWRPGKAPRLFGIDEWLGEIWQYPDRGALSSLDYAETAGIFAEVFGREAVGIFLFENLVDDQEAFIESLCCFMGVDPLGEWPRGLRKMENRRWTKRQVERLQALERSRFLATTFRFSSWHMRKRILGIGGSVSRSSKEAARADMAPEWRRRIIDLTRHGNRRLIEEWGLPLERYGYPL